jgi:plastocyanin
MQLRVGARFLLAALSNGLALASFAHVGFAVAKEIKVSMAGAQYEPAAIVAKAGDRLMLVNDDRVDHWVYVATVDHQVSGGPQKPGQALAVPLGRTGTFEIDCAFHSHMTATVTVRR